MHEYIHTSQIHYRHTNINRCSRLRWDFKIQKVEKNLQKCWSLLSSSETNAGKLKALKRDGRESSQQRINWWTKVYLWHSPGPKVESNCELKSIGWRVLVSPSSALCNEWVAKCSVYCSGALGQESGPLWELNHWPFCHHDNYINTLIKCHVLKRAFTGEALVCRHCCRCFLIYQRCPRYDWRNSGHPHCFHRN